MGPDANPATPEATGRPAVRRRVVLDVDTGVDDACALLLAALHPDLDLVAVTCVGGNADVDQVVANTLLVLGVAGRDDVPVARGAARPLLEAPVHARHVHGEDGMADLGWPRSTRSADARHAVELLRDVLLDAAQPGPDGEDRRVTLVPLAPLTNVALLLRTHPQAAAGLREIVFMGGAADVGNATASAEFNVFHDPEAAALVLDAATDLGVRVTMWGLDVFSGPRVTREQAQALVAVGGRGPAELAGRLVLHQCDRFGTDDATIGDAGAVCAVLDPQGRRTERRPVRVELTGAWTRGRTIVDRRPWDGDVSHDPHGLAPARVDVALEVLGPRYARLWLDTVSGVTEPGDPNRIRLARLGSGREPSRPNPIREARVVVVGAPAAEVTVVVDDAPAAGETVTAHLVRRAVGGRGPVHARAAAEAGAAVTFVGRVGDDADGLAVAQALAADGIGLALAVDPQAPTATRIVTQDADLAQRVVEVEGAAAALEAGDVTPPGGLGPGDVVLVTLAAPPSAVREAAARAQHAGARLVIHASPYRPLPPEVVAAADPLVAGETEAGLVAESGVLPASLLVTFGAAGCVWGTSRYDAPPGSDGRPVTTPEADDAFVGALAAALAAGADQDAAVAAARRAVPPAPPSSPPAESGAPWPQRTEATAGGWIRPVT